MTLRTNWRQRDRNDDSFRSSGPAAARPSERRKPLRLWISRRAARTRSGAEEFVTQVRFGKAEAVVVPWAPGEPASRAERQPDGRARGRSTAVTSSALRASGIELAGNIPVDDRERLQPQSRRIARRAPRELAMRGAGADQDRARRVEPVSARERERQSRQRRPAPAARRAAGVRTQCASAGPSTAAASRAARGRAPRRAARAPVEHEMRGAAGRPARARAPSPCDPARRGDEHAGPVRCPAWGGARTRSFPPGRIPRRSMAARARGTSASATSARARRTRRASSRSSSGVGERAEPLEHALDEVDLGLCERGVEPHAPDREPVPAAVSTT